MKLASYIKTIATFMIALIISLPFIFAQEYSRLYDANGNLVYDSQDDIYREYNELNQLSRTRQSNSTGIILQEYTWDPLKERIFIKDEFYSNGSLKSSTYYFDDDYIVLQNSSGTYNRTNIYQDGTLVGYEDFDGRKRYVLPDHKGSVHIVLNESVDIIEENLFSPFAEPLAGVKENKFSYEAKEYDSLVKDYDFHFRKFSVNGPPILNQPDTLIQNVYDPQSLNRYSFERNNPYKYTDPSGHCLDACFFEIMIPLLAILVIGHLTMMVEIAKVEEAKEIGYEEGIQKAKKEAYFNMFTSPIDLLFPGNKAVQVWSYTSTGSTIKDALWLISQPHKEFMQRIEYRNEVIQNAIKQFEQNSNQRANNIRKPGSSDPFGLGDLIQRWLTKNLEKKEELDKQAGGTSAYNSGGAATGSTDCSWWDTCTVKSTK